MVLLLLFSFLAGIATIASPCVLPLLPIILTTSLSGGKRRPIAVIIGFILSFTTISLFSYSILSYFNTTPAFLRQMGIFFLIIFGIALLLPKLKEYLFSSIKHPKRKLPHEGGGIVGGFLVGISLGVVWMPCVGPILGAMISIAATQQVTFQVLLITLVYATGAGLPMLAIGIGGKKLLNKFPWVLHNAETMQRIFGIIMIITALGLYFHIDNTIQSTVARYFPDLAAGLTGVEDNDAVIQQLGELQAK